MLGGSRVIGSARTAGAWFRGAVGAVAGVAVLEGVPGGGRVLRGAEWWQGWELGRKAVGQECCRAVEGFLREVRRQGAVDGLGGEIALQPGRDARDEVFRVRGGDQESGVLAAEAGQNA